jgi:hypothetical protein
MNGEEAANSWQQGERPTHTEDEPADLLGVVYNLAYLIEKTKDPVKVSEYVDQLNRLKPKLIALGSAKKAAGQS